MTHVFSLLPRIWLMSWKGMCRRPGMVLFLCEDRIKAIRVIGINQNLKKKKSHRAGEFGNYIITNFWSRMKIFSGIGVVGGHRARANEIMVSLILVKPVSAAVCFHISWVPILFQRRPYPPSAKPPNFPQGQLLCIYFLPDIRRNKVFLVVLFALPKKKVSSLGEQWLHPNANN